MSDSVFFEDHDWEMQDAYAPQSVKEYTGRQLCLNEPVPSELCEYDYMGPVPAPSAASSAFQPSGSSEELEVITSNIAAHLLQNDGQTQYIEPAAWTSQSQTSMTNHPRPHDPFNVVHMKLEQTVDWPMVTLGAMLSHCVFSLRCLTGAVSADEYATRVLSDAESFLQVTDRFAASPSNIMFAISSHFFSRGQLITVGYDDLHGGNRDHSRNARAIYRQAIRQGANIKKGTQPHPPPQGHWSVQSARDNEHAVMTAVVTLAAQAVATCQAGITHLPGPQGEIADLMRYMISYVKCWYHWNDITRGFYDRQRDLKLDRAADIMDAHLGGVAAEFSDRTQTGA